MADLPPLRDVINRHGLFASKALGQNFLFDEQLLDRIAALPGKLKGQQVLEVGPGPGGLTRALLRAGAQVTAIEMDRRCLPALAELSEAFPGQLTVIEGDATKVAHGIEGPFHIVANLPYNVGTPLLIGWLARPDAFASLTLMLQKEVVDRLVAAPASAAYGRLAVAAQWRWHVRRLFDVPPSAFVPPPQVVSSVVGLVPRESPLADADPGWLERVVAAAFGQRRKMLRSALRSLGADPLPRLAHAGIDPSVRAETLPIEAFCALARAYRTLASGPPAGT